MADGGFYDWSITRRPERPYTHAYHQTVVIKISLADKRPGGQSRTHLTFAQALGVIERLDRLTCGMPKIAYLVGWQHDGHDSKYPSWAQVNPRLKRPTDPTSQDSLTWLMREARRHHTVVSLHVNMIDAFEDSPLWSEYLARDVIAKGRDGTPLKGEVHGSWIGPETQSYQISYAREWETGLAQRRIDGLLELLPIAESGTIHIDAFHSLAPVRPHDDTISPLLGYSIGREIETQRKIFRTFRERGIDATAEGAAYWLRRDPFVGLQGFAWHYHGIDGVPSDLYCGTPMQAESEIFRDPDYLGGLREAFATRAVPWLFHNAPADRRTAAKDMELQKGGESCCPAVWLDQTLIAFSRNGCENRRWSLPTDFPRDGMALLSDLTVDGPTPAELVPIENGAIRLTLTPQRGVMITVAHRR